jgi:alkylhydroperoxidase/carboxymuconolactone decarboxylase family protein YurZ
MRKPTIHITIALIISLLSISDHADAQDDRAENQSLSKKNQSIVLISAYTAKGDLVQLEDALHNGLDAGLTVNEIKEVLVHLYAYCGFPRSIRGLNTLMAVVEERKADGIEDEMGPEASPITDERSKYGRGVETLYELTGEKWGYPESGYGAFAPAIDRFLKEHLFADIFERDVLTYQQRELVTISALSSMGGVEPMLQGHIGIGMNVGLTESQLEQTFSIIATNVGEAEAKAGIEILSQIRNSN